MGGEVLEKLRDYYGIHWIGIKFYSTMKELKGLKDENENYNNGELFPSKKRKYRFCEALDEAVSHPLYLDSKSLDCGRAKFVFGWNLKSKNDIMKNCQEKVKLSNEEVKNLFHNFSEIDRDIQCIGLNTSKSPDLAIAYLNPKVAMEIVRKYNKNNMKNLNISVSSVMSICGSLVIRSYLEDDITLSFGCRDSRQYSNIDRDRLAICIPQRLFRVILPSQYQSTPISVKK